MGFPLIVTGNLLGDDTTITPGAGIDSAQSNRLMYDKRSYTLYAVTVPAGGVTDIEFDLAAAASSNTVTILDHTIPSACTVKVYQANTSPANELVHTFTHNDGFLFARALTTLTKKVRRIEFTLAGGGTFDFGQIVFEDETALGEGFDWTYSPDEDVKHTGKRSAGGARLTDLITSVYNLRAEFGKSDGVMDDARNQLRQIWEDVNRGMDPFVWVPNSEVLTEVHYTHLVDPPWRQDVSGVQKNRIPWNLEGQVPALRA